VRRLLVQRFLLGCFYVQQAQTLPRGAVMLPRMLMHKILEPR
jgi:hypothetical protein